MLDSSLTLHFIALRSEFDEDECGSQSFSLIEQSVSCSDEILFLPWIELEESSIPPLTLPCSSSGKFRICIIRTFLCCIILLKIFLSMAIICLMRLKYLFIL